MMNKKIPFPIAIIIIITCAVLAGGLVWQYSEIKRGEPEIDILKKDETADLSSKALATEDWETYRNAEYGFEISYPATVNKGSESEREVYFSIPLDALRSMTVRIFADEKPSVPLWGSYGGDFPFKEVAPDTPVFRGLMHSEEVVLNSVPFQKDYWIEYGGMGSWSTVINCYAEYRGNWYMISLLNSRAFFHVPETSSDDAETRQRLLSEMLDNENEYIKTFNQMLFTFRFIEDETTNWQTYRNEDYGFKIKYPLDFQIIIIEKLGFVSIHPIREGIGSDLVIEIRDRKPNQTWQEFIAGGGIVEKEAGENIWDEYSYYKDKIEVRYFSRGSADTVSHDFFILCKDQNAVPTKGIDIYYWSRQAALGNSFADEYQEIIKTIEVFPENIPCP